MSKQNQLNPIECKKEDLLSPYSYQILRFVTTIEHSRNLKSYISYGINKLNFKLDEKF